MSRARVSTTVDESLLAQARSCMEGANDASVIDAALEALVRARRSAEFDAAYSVYESHPLDEPDEWGDLASFVDAVSRS